MLNSDKPKPTAVAKSENKPTTKKPPFKNNVGAKGKPVNKFKTAGKRGFEGKNNKFAAGGKPQAGQNEVSEKQDWNKFKQEKKELKLKRKSNRDTYEVTQEVKKIYEQVKW